MTKGKKIMAMLLCAVMCLSLFPTLALAEEITEPADNASAELLQEEQIQEEVYEEPAENNEQYAAEDTETEAAIEEVNVPDPAVELESEIADQGEEAGTEEAETEPESAEVVEQMEGSEVSSTDTVEESAAVEDTTEETPVTVVFNVTPEDAVVTVYTKDNPDDPEEKTVIDPEEDGSYLLLPGEYYYDVVAEGYEPVEETAFKTSKEKVTEDDEIVKIVVTLSYISNEKQFSNIHEEQQAKNKDIAIEDEILLTPAEEAELMSLQGVASGRYEVLNTKNVSGAAIVNEAKKWLNAGATYWSGIDPWEKSIAWRTGYTCDGQTSFDCSGFVARVLNDVGFRGASYAPAYGNNVLKTNYGSNFIAISIEDLVNYGTNINNAVSRAKNGDYSDLAIGDIIGWVNGTPAEYKRHIIIYAGLVNNVPYMIEFTGSGCLYRAVTAKYQSLFESGARLTLESLSYLDKCTYLPSYLTIKATTSTTVKSLPCSASTDSSSTNIVTLSSGDTFNVTGMYKNTAGNYWYKGATSNGKAGYVYSGDFSVTSYRSNITYSGKAFPSSLTVGNTYAVDWTIKSDYLNLTTINGYIYGGSNLNEVKYSGSLTNVNATSKSLGNSAVDNALLFDKLSAGTYKMTITASVVNNYCTDGKTLATKTMSATPISFIFTESASTATHYFDLNGYLDGTEKGHIAGFGTVDVYINGNLDSGGTDDYYKAWPRGTRYEVKNIQAKPGHQYNGVKEGSTSGTIGDSDVSVRLSFSTETYTISYNANGGSGAPSNQVKTYGNDLTLSSTIPTRTGYIFAGWSTSSTATVATYPAGSVFKVDANTTLYAVWSMTYTISYNANGGNSAPASQTKYSGETVYLSAVEPTRNCHVFKGWATSPNATTAQYQPGEAYSNDANLTLYAVWSEGTYTEWSTTVPSGIEQSRIESKVQFRYSYKEYTTDTVAEKEGWTLDSSETVWSNYGPWTEWSTTKINGSDSVKVETRTVYSYYYFVCSKCGAHMHGSGTCYSWAGGCGASGTVSSGSYHQVWLTTPYSSSSDFHGTGVNYITSSDGTVFTYTSTSSPHYVAPTTQYRSCTRTQSTVYTFYRWGEWSTWSDVGYAQNENRKVETRVVYRYLLDGNETHAWDNGTVLKAATCTEDGSIQYTCLKCGKTRVEVLGKLGHQYTETVTAPTCTERGYSTFYCAGCGDSYIDKYVNALGHSWNAGVITKAATCTAAGTMTYTCSRCSETKTETIPATGHIWGNWTVTKAATCTANGTETRYCTNDVSHTETRDITALGHNYVNGYCSRCGEKDPQASVTVRYDANGGTGAPAIQTVSLGETVKLSDAKPTKEGAAFLGWATSANATTAAYQPGGDFKANADTVLYAVWKTGTYTITFDANGGTRAPNAQIKDHGAALVLSEQEPVRTGYTFQGWSIEKDSDYIDYHPGETYLADKDATLYAVWTVKTYDVRYNANGGNRAPATQTKTHGVDLKLSDKEPVRDGYEFQGWAKTQNTEYVDFYPGDLYRTEADVTLYAVWNASSSTVTVSLKKTSLTLAADGSDTLKAETSAANAELVWSSNNEAVATVDRNGKVTGHSVGTAVITVMVKGSGSSAECEVNVLFRDVVKMTDYFYEPVYWAVENGITSGTSATTFSPYNACTRAQVMSFLWKANGSPIVGGSNPFTDVKTSDYFYNAVLWAVSRGITAGTTATTFSPYNTCTRAQVMTFLYKAMG